MNRWSYIVAGTLALIVLAIVAALHFAARSVEDSIREALGPEGEAAEITVRLTSIELVDVRIGAPRGWPADTTLRARRVIVTPDVRHLLSDEIELTRIEVHGGYLSVLRPRQGGGLRVMPTLADRARSKKQQGEERRGVTIDTVTLSDCVIEIFDATVGPKSSVRLDGVKGTVRGIRVPELDTRSQVDLQSLVKGPNRSGTVALKGWVEVGQRNARLAARVRDVDLALFEPYVIAKMKSEIESGTFGLDLDSQVRDNVVDAKGTLTVSALKLKPGETPIDALAGLPRRAALGALADEQGTITVPFTLAGNLDDPSFSLAGDTALQTGLAVAKALGMSFEGLVRAFLIMVNGLGSAFGSLVPR